MHLPLVPTVRADRKCSIERKACHLHDDSENKTNGTRWVEVRQPHAVRRSSRADCMSHYTTNAFNVLYRQATRKVDRAKERLYERFLYIFCTYCAMFFINICVQCTHIKLQMDTCTYDWLPTYFVSLIFRGIKAKDKNNNNNRWQWIDQTILKPLQNHFIFTV